MPLLTVLALTGAAGCRDGGAGAAGDAGASGGAGRPGAGGSAGASSTDCEFVVRRNETSDRIPTVGIVEWSLSGEPPSSARILYRLDDGGSASLNRSGAAPVDLDEPGFRTLLLGLKQSSDYRFQIEATRAGRTCTSEEYLLPTTGSYPEAPAITRQLARPDAREPGFIVTSSGTSLPPSAFIIDADGEIVWYVEGPQNPTRARMDYEGRNMWMVGLNLTNQVGEMRRVSMDGEEEQRDVPGLERAHHDFTVMPGGRVAALVWGGPGIDPPSDLLIRSPDGALTVAFAIGANLYRSDTYHANAIHYVPFDGGFTIADRNPSLVVKVSAEGSPQWQLGGACEDAPVGASCSPRDWSVIHGHHLLEDGAFVLFDNESVDEARVFEFQLDAEPGALRATLVEEYVGTAASSNLGDVQRLPSGNTLITYSAAGEIVEVDPDWNPVQTFGVRIGYTSWRPTLYGAPFRP